MKVVGAAPALDAVGDVAGLARNVAAAVAVEDPRADLGAGARGVDHGLFGQPDVGIGGVAEHEQVEGFAGATGVDRPHHRAGGADDARRVFVVGRHQQRRAGRRGGIRRRCAFGAEEKSISGDMAPKPIHAMLMTKRPSITFSTPVSSPTESTSHIWCTSSTVSRSEASTRPARASRTPSSLGTRRRTWS